MRDVVLVRAREMGGNLSASNDRNWTGPAHSGEPIVSTEIPEAPEARDGPKSPAREGAARSEEDPESIGTRGGRGTGEGAECIYREAPAPPAPQWVAICRLDDIVPNTGVCALVGGSQVAVFRLDDDSIHAIANHDPFSGANVISRGIVGDLKGQLVVASPVYKQHFSLASGECLEEPQVRLAVYRVRLEDGMVCVEI